MNRFLIGFVFMILTARFFTETLSMAPKAFDLLDLAVIPILLFVSLVRPVSGDVDLNLHRKVVTYTTIFFLLCILSCLVNFERVSFGPVVLYIFGMLEGPIFFIALNKLIRDKHKFGAQVGRFINLILIVEMCVVAFVSYPMVIASGNPDKMSGTFGNNSYQFTALLIIMGGYFIGRQYARPKSIYFALGIQFFLIMTFLLLQYRTALPAFFVSYAILLGIIYGRQFVRLTLILVPLVGITFYGFRFVQNKDLDLKYEDLLTVGRDPEMVKQFGKYLSYVNTVTMFSENPLAILFGCGPGTYVSRANYTFTAEISDDRGKGVGSIITSVFGDKNYYTDVFVRYIYPLSNLETAFGSVQINNPNSSVLAAAAELGLPGLFVLFGLYVAVVRRSYRYLQYAKETRDEELLPLASSLFIGSVYLLLISPLDNYLEIARVTIPIWLLFWTVSTIVHERYREALALMAVEEEEGRRHEMLTE
jgi:hypothetical protein